jgi:hypothetical protein
MKQEQANNHSDSSTPLDKKEVLHLFERRLIILQKREQNIKPSGDKNLTDTEIHLNQITSNYLQGIQRELIQLSNQIKALN